MWSNITYALTMAGFACLVAATIIDYFHAH